ncbi:hypothetical protein RW1_040_00350 [Rhodococcus wratislaviensis NBRC 100605]|uniref:NodB homology domain-containing protein n=2 Tax=Rhodococcus wratislaviensis TaxID=44752 RepID=X0PVU6_RHOWR|nr:hypothetical protein RW1_040_00350 [Rhodococcus wratislaviensis NBRC 100605]
MSTVQPATPEKVITTFQTGHGWTSSGATVTGSSLNFTGGNAPYGTQCARLVTNGLNADAILDGPIMGAPVDIRGKALRVTFRVNDYMKYVKLELHAGNGSGITNSYSWRFSNGEGAGAGWHYTRGGEWCSITLNFGDAVTNGTPDPTAINHFRITVQDNSTALTFDVNEVAIVENQKVYPNGVVTFCFDDQDATVWSAARPALDKYRFPATMFTIREYVGQSGYCTLDQLKTLERDHGWEVAAHADSATVHTASYTGVSDDVALSDMRKIRAWLAENGFKGKDHLAYPHGDYDADTIAQARKVFATARGTVRRTHHETLPPGDPHRVRCIEVLNTDTAATIQAEIDKCVAAGSWLTLLFHVVASPADGLTKYLPADFATIVDYVAASGAAVRTYGDAVTTSIQTAATRPVEKAMASCSASTDTPDSTTPALVPGMSLTFTSVGPACEYELAVEADIGVITGGTQIFIGSLYVDGVKQSRDIFTQAAGAMRVANRKTWKVAGLSPGRHTAEFRHAKNATGTAAFRVYAFASTIEVTRRS